MTKPYPTSALFSVHLSGSPAIYCILSSPAPNSRHNTTHRMAAASLLARSCPALALGAFSSPKRQQLARRAAGVAPVTARVHRRGASFRGGAGLRCSAGGDSAEDGSNDDKGAAETSDEASAAAAAAGDNASIAETIAAMAAAAAATNAKLRLQLEKAMAAAVTEQDFPLATKLRNELHVLNEAGPNGVMGYTHPLL